MAKTQTRTRPMPPTMQDAPIIHGDVEVIKHWLTFYWRKLHLPSHELPHVAITQDRNEYRLWTGKRLNVMALGCYWYYGGASPLSKSRAARSSRGESSEPHRHLIFIEPTLQPQSVEVTVAHELIHLADRVNGTPRRHTHHGYDSIADDEATITGYAPEELRALLREESERLDLARRERRPIRYLYECPHCGRQYPRTRRYTHAVSCSNCDKRYNPQFQLSLRTPDAS